jgi:hypothetical protein
VNKKIALVAALAAFVVACGPSQADIEAKAKAVADSLARDSADKAMAAQAIQDSLNRLAAMDTVRVDTAATATN